MAPSNAAFQAFGRLHSACTTAQPGAKITVAAEDVRLVIDGAAEIDRHTQALTRELAEAKTRLIEQAAGDRLPPDSASGAPAETSVVQEPTP